MKEIWKFSVKSSSKHSHPQFLGISCKWQINSGQIASMQSSTFWLAGFQHAGGFGVLAMNSVVLSLWDYLLTRFAADISIFLFNSLALYCYNDILI
jgi:hypothetical protein